MFEGLNINKIKKTCSIGFENRILTYSCRNITATAERTNFAGAGNGIDSLHGSGEQILAQELHYIHFNWNYQYEFDVVEWYKHGRIIVLDFKLKEKIMNNLSSVLQVTLSREFFSRDKISNIADVPVVHNIGCDHNCILNTQIEVNLTEWIISQQIQ